jgi:chemotaxis receptor (MCP) glutamine deamidase CheD
VGEIVASAKPMLLKTLLGSCVTACLHDPVAAVGGMNHILLPGSCEGERQLSRCGVHAMELLINAIVGVGGDRRRLVAKVFGGGNVVASLQSPTIGELNVSFIRNFLATEKIPLVGQRLGGKQAVLVNFHTNTGKAVVRTVDGSRLLSILSSESDYRCSLAQANTGGDITLF